MNLQTNLTLAAAILALAPAAPAATILAHFTGNGGSRLWTNANNWSPTGVPANSSANQYEVTLSDRVVLDTVRTVDKLTVPVGATLAMDLSLTVAKSIQNDSLIEMTGAGNVSLTLTSRDKLPVAIEGGGILRMARNTHRLSIIDRNTPFINGNAHTIDGFGNIQFTSTTFTNQGLVNANVAGETLLVQGGNLNLDEGELRAENGGILSLSGVNLTGQGENRLIVGDGSTLTLSNATLMNTTIQYDDNNGNLVDNLVRIGASSVTVNGVRNDTLLQIPGANVAVKMDGLLVNNSVIEMTTDLPGFARLSTIGTAQLQGNGTLFMQNATKHHLDAVSNSPTDPDRFIHGANHTIKGFGFIGTILERFENHGLIEATMKDLGGPLSLAVGRQHDFFVNERGGILRASDNDIIVKSTPAGHRLINRGLIDLGSNVFDAGIHGTLGNSPKGMIVQEEGELRVNGILMAEEITIKSGLVTGAGIIRADRFTAGIIKGHGGSAGQTVTIRPHGIDGSSIGRLLFLANDPTPPFPNAHCSTVYGPVAPQGLLPFTDVLSLDNVTLQLEIESMEKFDSIGHGGNVIVQGGASLELFYTGPAGGLGECDPDLLIPPATCGIIPLMNDAVIPYAIPDNSNPNFVNPHRRPNPCLPGTVIDGSLTGTGVVFGSQYIQGDTIYQPGALIPGAGGARTEDKRINDIRTVDGRVTFKLVQVGRSNGSTRLGLQYDQVYLTEPVMANELAPQSYSFTVAELSEIGSTVATIAKPATMPGTATFSLIGDSPFAIDRDTGVLTVARLIDFEVGPTDYAVTINVFDEDNVQINPTTFAITNVFEDLALRVRERLTGPAGPFPNETDPNIIGLTADPDRDGITNIYELLLQTNPAVGDSPHYYTLTRVAKGDEFFPVLQVEVDPEFDDLLTVRGTFSSNLQVFRDGTRSVRFDNGYSRRLEFTDTVPDAGRAVFARLELDLGERQ